MGPPRDQRTSPSSSWSSQQGACVCRDYDAQRRRAVLGPFGSSGPGVTPVGAGASGLLRVSAAGRVAGFGGSVGPCGTAGKPLAALGLGLTVALRVRFVRAGGAG